MLPRLRTRGSREIVLNVIPFVDILFLLIVFFILASRFIAPEAFTVDIPDGVDGARSVSRADATATVTLMRWPDGRTDYSIGSVVIAAPDRARLVENLSAAIDSRLEFLPAEKRIVVLRADRHIPYKDVQYAIAAVAHSNASAVRLAVMRQKVR